MEHHGKTLRVAKSHIGLGKVMESHRESERVIGIHGEP